MKRFFAVILALLLCIALLGCQGAGTLPQEDSDKSAFPELQDEETAEPVQSLREAARPDRVGFYDPERDYGALPRCRTRCLMREHRGEDDLWDAAAVHRARTVNMDYEVRAYTGHGGGIARGGSFWADAPG